MNYKFKHATDMMWKLADKPERMRVFTRIVCECHIPKKQHVDFWKNFWAIWETSENLHEEQHNINYLMNFGKNLTAKSIAGLEQSEQEELQNLPDTITVYRGAIPDNYGWSWTLDESKAAFFAKRAVGSSKRIIYTGKVQKNKVLGYLTGRNESEIIVHPDNVRNKKIHHAYDEVTRSMDSLIYQIHSGKLDFGDTELRAKMLVDVSNDTQIKHYLDHINEHIDFADWAELKIVEYWNHILKLTEGKTFKDVSPHHQF